MGSGKAICVGKRNEMGTCVETGFLTDREANETQIGHGVILRGSDHEAKKIVCVVILRQTGHEVTEIDHGEEKEIDHGGEMTACRLRITRWRVAPGLPMKWKTRSCSSRSTYR